MKKVNSENKLDNTKLDLFKTLAALDKKDYGYYDRLTEEQKKEFNPYMLVQWLSSVKANSEVQGYYVLSTEYHANKYLFNEHVYANPKLQWLMLCAASPNIGQYYHEYISQISTSVSQLKKVPDKKDMKEFFKKLYPKAVEETLTELSDTFVTEHKRKVYLAKTFPDLKINDIEILSKLITDNDIEQYERDSGNQ